MVGTVIDSDIPDGELRVTLVATGLGKQPVKQEGKPEIAAVKPDHMGKVDYSKLDKPISVREGSKKVAGDSVEVPDLNSRENMDYLDIPAFLRRQAD